MKLVYFGTAEFAVPALQALAPHVALVVSQPDRPTGRGLRTQASPVRQAAEALGLPVLTPERARDPEFIAHIESLQADALVVAAYGQILRERLLHAARAGALNLHGSLLPRWRGAAPIQRAIQAGDSETGVTLMQMDRGMDTGAMLAEVATPIGPDETAGELTARLALLAAELTRTHVPLALEDGRLPRRPQPEEGACHAPKVEKAEAELDPGRDALAEYRRYRAFTPTPGAWILGPEGPVRITRAAYRPDLALPPGTVSITPQGLSVGFVGGSLELLEVQPAGRKRMSGRDAANGLRLRTGDPLHSP